jgi:hypothetical protein
MYQKYVHKMSCKCIQINLLRGLLAIMKEVEFIFLMKPNTMMSTHHKQYKKTNLTTVHKFEKDF